MQEDITPALNQTTAIKDHIKNVSKKIRSVCHKIVVWSLSNNNYFTHHSYVMHNYIDFKTVWTDYCFVFAYLFALAIRWRQNTCHVGCVRAIKLSQVSRSLQLANECWSDIMIKNEKNCSVRADSYVLQYRLDRAEVVSTIRTKNTFWYLKNDVALRHYATKVVFISSSVVLHWAMFTIFLLFITI